jgi:Fe2+ or Zn2+ uptake regulation protein
MKFSEESKNALKEVSVTPTKQRVAVLSALMGSAGPITIDQLEKKVKNSVNYVTLYRILKLFVDKNLVYQTDFREGKAYFEYQEDGHHHHHIVCTKCGHKEKTNDCHETDSYAHVLRQSRKFKLITSHSLEFFGICNTCSSR